MQVHPNRSFDGRRCGYGVCCRSPTSCWRGILGLRAYDHIAELHATLELYRHNHGNPEIHHAAQFRRKFGNARRDVGFSERLFPIVRPRTEPERNETICW